MLWGYSNVSGRPQRHTALRHTKGSLECEFPDAGGKEGVREPKAPLPAEHLPAPDGHVVGFCQHVWWMNLGGHIWKIQEKGKFMQTFIWLFTHHCLVNMVQKPCHNKLPFERDGVYSALIGLESWQARSLGEASRLFPTAAGQSSAVERRRSTTTVAAAHGPGRQAWVRRDHLLRHHRPHLA